MFHSKVVFLSFLFFLVELRFFWGVVNKNFFWGEGKISFSLRGV